jgi:hypothetical protein
MQELDARLGSSLISMEYDGPLCLALKACPSIPKGLENPGHDLLAVRFAGLLCSATCRSPFHDRRRMQKESRAPQAQVEGPSGRSRLKIHDLFVRKSIYGYV